MEFPAVFISSKVLQRNAKHEARLSNISVFGFLELARDSSTSLEMTCFCCPANFLRRYGRGGRVGRGRGIGVPLGTAVAVGVGVGVVFTGSLSVNAFCW